MEVITTYGFCTTKSASVTQATDTADASTAAAESNPNDPKLAKKAAKDQAKLGKIVRNDADLRFSKKHKKGTVIGPVDTPSANAGRRNSAAAVKLNKENKAAAKGEKPTAPKV